MAFDATVGGASATSYVSLAEATAYLADRLNSAAWTNAVSDGVRQQALMQATAWLDTLAYHGVKATVTQRLAHPRQYLPTQERNPVYLAGTTVPYLDEALLYYPSTAIARPLVEATCELALELLRASTTDLSTVDASEGVIREKVGPIETEYATPTLRRQGLQKYPSVWMRLKPLLQHAGSLTVTRG